MREGRGTLHTCFGFLQVPDNVTACSSACLNWQAITLGVIISQMDYIMIDGGGSNRAGILHVPNPPAAKLGKERPTSSLLSAINVGSILGAFIHQTLSF
eukprot:jgi/Botrbrau1/17580/Bobra.0166s0022.1